MTKVEIQHINRQFEHLRLKDARREQRLLSEILEEGLNEALGCLLKKDEWILLDGFKRLRCCEKLKIHKVEVMNLGQDDPLAPCYNWTKVCGKIIGPNRG